MPFIKGQSGNPGGRPKAVREVEQLAREYSDDAMARVIQIMKVSDDEKAALRAAEIVLDRAWGKPKQTIDATVKTDLVAAITAGWQRAKSCG